MKMGKLKKFAATSALGLSLMTVLGLSNASSVQAQNGRWDRTQRNDGWIDRNRNGVDDRNETNRRIDRNRNGVNDRYESRRPIDRNRNGVNDRYEADRNRNGVSDAYEVDRNRNGVYDTYEVDRNRNGVNDRYENNGRSGNYGYNSAEYQKGYRDGLQRGREDAQTNRAMTPNNSSHYRKGSAVYREGFERGFYESYRQYSNRRW